MDASAAKGIIERKGISKIRHLHTDVLWLQEQQLRRIMPLQKVKGWDNPADMMTKNLTAEVSNNHLQKFRLEYKEGRAEKAAKLHSLG